MNTATITIHGEEFIVIPKGEYDRLRGVPDGSVEAVPYAMHSIGASIRKARETAGLTQLELARKMKRSQSFVSEAESGASRVGERYIKAVLKACGLPEDWNG
jgi:ribosome-binding protein aMBF1 (putative translation factor)